jgi:mono/diheme cytochrome c family protein
MLLAILVLGGPISAQAQTSNNESYEALATVVLPSGDPRQGRQAFQDLKCHVCHRVAGETTLAPPFADARGPDLDASLRRQDASDIATAILVPSHSSSVKSSERVKRMLSAQLKSPMADYSRVLTVRQLADLLAYLHSLR